jgi:hypothetical protein
LYYLTGRQYIHTYMFVYRISDDSGANYILTTPDTRTDDSKMNSHLWEDAHSFRGPSTLGRGSNLSWRPLQPVVSSRECLYSPHDPRWNAKQLTFQSRLLNAYCHPARFWIRHLALTWSGMCRLKPSLGIACRRECTSVMAIRSLLLCVH